MDEIESLELKIAKFLRCGILLASTLMLIGWVSHLIQHGSSFETFKIYQPTSLIGSIQLSLLHHSWGELTSFLGLIILISLPLIRVFLTAFLFLRQKEYLLAAVAAFVLVALVASFSLGIEL